MSWFNECTLTYEEVQEVLLYLQILRISVKVNLLSEEKLTDLINKIERWLEKEV